MKTISLCGKHGAGKHAIIDDEDYESASQYRWHLMKGYVRARTGDGYSQPVFLHRFINRTPDGFLTDHINGNKLDNRRSNLRSCLHAQNMRNRGGRKANRSGYRGVSWSEPLARWRALIRINKKLVHLGYFDRIADASAAYEKAASETYGEFYRPIHLRKESIYA